MANIIVSDISPEVVEETARRCALWAADEKATPFPQCDVLKDAAEQLRAQSAAMTAEPSGFGAILDEYEGAQAERLRDFVMAAPWFDPVTMIGRSAVDVVIERLAPEPDGPQTDTSLTIHQITGSDFCMLIPTALLPEDDMRPQESQSMLRSLWTAMEFGGWLFVDWGECHGTHSEAWFIRKQPPTKGAGDAQ